MHALPASAPAVSQAIGRDDAAYHAVPAHGGFLATNGVQHLRTSFTAAGVRVSSGAVQLRMRLAQAGYGHQLSGVGTAAPRATGNTVTYKRGWVTDWYVNGPAGIEQGFTVAHRPALTRSGPLTLALDIGGNARIAVSHGGSAAAFTHARSSLVYRDLRVRDATGRTLPAHLAAVGHRLLIEVNDAGARYPLRIDPFVQQAELTASDGGADGEFGWSVAIGGTTAVVGAVNSGTEPGAVYVFTDSAGNWTQQQKLTASDGYAADFFGYSVAISGNMIVVGAPSNPGAGTPTPGAAYVFTDSGGTWTQTQELTPSDGKQLDFFGSSVATDGSTIVVGSPSANSGVGNAYVFTSSGGTWTQQQELSASDADGFGSSVAIDGTTLVAGASGTRGAGGTPNTGSAYVYTNNGSSWSQQQELTPSHLSGGDQFGNSVAISHSTIVVGAPHHRVGRAAFAGAAYVYVGSGGTWRKRAKLTEPTPVVNDTFGYSVAVEGGRILVGTPQQLACHSNSCEGVAYLFAGSGSSWTEKQALSASDGSRGGAFGYSVALSGREALIGAAFQTINANQGQGSAYVFAAPTPGIFRDLLVDSRGVGPGRTLVHKVKLARSKYVAGNVTGTCATLDGYIREVNTQTGTTITKAQARELLEDAHELQAKIGCPGH